MKIKITAEQIKDAIRNNSHHCMIAEAIRDQVEGARQIIVDAQSIRWSSTVTGLRYLYLTPPEAQKALIRFDKGESVKPFELVLSEPTMVRPRKLNPTTLMPYEVQRKRKKKLAPQNRVVRHAKRGFGLRALAEEEA